MFTSTLDDGEAATAAEVVQVHQGIPQIPVDLFVNKKRQKKKNDSSSSSSKCFFPLSAGRRLRFTDAFGNLVYEVADSFSSAPSSPSSSSLRPLRVLLDASGNSVLSIFRSSDDDSWKVFQGDSSKDEDLLLTVERTLNTFEKIELQVLLKGANGKDSSFKMKGCLFWRSCTIYEDNRILAQTSLMYKLGLGKVFVRRSKFRVTTFPGFTDLTSIAALVLIFLDGRK
ncbi:hypothetical protein Dimus_009021 [Dionaea muscipula]